MNEQSCYEGPEETLKQTQDYIVHAETDLYTGLFIHENRHPRNEFQDLLGELSLAFKIGEVSRTHKEGVPGWDNQRTTLPGCNTWSPTSLSSCVWVSGPRGWHTFTPLKSQLFPGI